MIIKEATIGQEHHGQRIDVVLAKLFPEFSRQQLTTWLKQGDIIINDRGFKPKEAVRGGEKVVLKVKQDPREDELQAEEIPLNIVFEDEHVLVINKPAGLVVHPGAGNKRHTLVNALLYHDPSLQFLPRAGIVHRLDKDTTGLLLVAKTLNAYTNLVRQMQNREIKRHYQALVVGHLISGASIETNYGKHPRNRLKMSVLKQGREAITSFSIAHQYQYVTLLNISLMTGRTHQIRVHLAHIHHPIIGDKLYGGPMRLRGEIPDDVRQLLISFKRQALHASSLAFTHPETLELLTLNAQLPEDFQYLLTILDANIGQP